MATIIENINSLITTKNELNSILNENGVDGGEIFSEYPDKFRSVIAGGGGGGNDKVSYSYLNEKLSYYTTYTYIESNYVSYGYLGNLDDITYYIMGSGDPYAPENVYATKSYVNTKLENYATQSYVVDYVNTYAPTPDLSSYVTYTYLESKEYIQINGFYDTALSYDLCTEQNVTDQIESTLSTAGYISSIPSDYATYTGISGLGYVTSTDIENASYVSINSLSSMSYATASQLPVIDENIIPKENNTYTLGLSNYNFNTTYTSNLFLGSYNIKDLINGMFSYDSTTGTLTITTMS